MTQSNGLLLPNELDNLTGDPADIAKTMLRHHAADAAEALNRLDLTTAHHVIENLPLDTAVHIFEQSHLSAPLNSSRT